MANLDRLFIKLSEELTISIAKRDSLKRSRDALRQDIRDWFIENGKRVPLFSGQGSYAMKTLINPINGNEYDIDDGIYIIGYDNQESSDWPNPSTIHSWIKKAVEDRTKAGVIDKDTCIRVVYSNGYHIDLPAYICKGDNAYLRYPKHGLKYNALQYSKSLVLIVMLRLYIERTRREEYFTSGFATKVVTSPMGISSMTVITS